MFIVMTLLNGDQRVASSRLTSHCVVSLIKTLYPLLSTGSTQPGRKGDPPDMTENC